MKLRLVAIGLALTAVLLTLNFFLTRASGQQPTMPTAATYYVRPDGGSADQCTGMVNAPYPGSGTAQPCAWDHPFRALPPGGTARIAGGDTLIIANGSYMMGYGAPGADNCDAGGAFDCFMPPVPSGPNASNPTRMVGANWNSGCSSRPQLWGTERADHIIDLTSASYVEIGCLELTDHLACIEFHPSMPCRRDNPPYGAWANYGIIASDSANVFLHDLDIHGLSNSGIWAGRLRDWTVENVRLAMNGLSGWNGDIGASSSNTGTLIFHRWLVEWNGCGETYPGGQPIGCWGQESGGYGDGVGTQATQGRWIIEDSTFQYNTQDGLDLLYARTGSSIEIYRSLSRANAGDQFKVSGPTVMENDVAISHCSFFNGKGFTVANWNDDCRAGAAALIISMRTGDVVTVTNSTFSGEGNCILSAEMAAGQTANGTETVRVRNSIIQGQPAFGQGGTDTCFGFYDNESSNPMPTNPFTVTYAVIDGTRFGNVTPCPGPNNLCAVATGLVITNISSFDGHLLAGSPAINSANAAWAPATDKDGLPRDSQPDRGAYEYRAFSWRDYLPLLRR